MATVDLLVTGGTSFLGVEVVRQAVDSGRSVAATRHRSAPQERRADWHRLDITDAAAVDRLVRALRPRAVLHLAAVDRGEGVSEITADGAGAVARAAAAVGARLVHISSDVVYAGDEDRPYTEDDRPAPVSPYARAKARAEELVAAACPAAALVRTSLILGGPDRPSKHELAVLRELDAPSGMAFFCDETRCPVHVADLAAAVRELAGSTWSGPLNVAGPEVLSRFDLARRVAGAFGRDGSGLVCARSADHPEPRPRLLALDLSRARRTLGTPLRPASAFL